MLPAGRLLRRVCLAATAAADELPKAAQDILFKRVLESLKSPCFVKMIVALLAHLTGLYGPNFGL